MQLHLRTAFTLIGFLLSYTLVAQLPTTIDATVAGFSEARLERLSNFLDEEIEAQHIPGGVCWIVRKGVTAHQATYGYRNLAEEEAIQADQIFYIQSMTKPIISVAFMMLYEEGHFELTDPLFRYLPEFKEMNVAKVNPENPEEMTWVALENPIRLEHLLSHQAGFLHGLSNMPLDVQYREALYGQDYTTNTHETIEDRAMAMSKLPLAGQPGEQWMYSAAPDILALLIEKFSGQTVPEFLQERIFEPLGMNDTGYNLTEKQAERVVGLHLKNEENQVFYSPRQTPTTDNTIFGGTHGLFSTAEDYLKFATMLLQEGEYDGRRLLSRKTVELMTINHVGKKRGEGDGFGLGFGIRTNMAAADGLASEGTFFWSGAYNTYFFVDPKEELIGILMLQFAPYTDYYNRKFRQLVYQAIVD